MKMANGALCTLAVGFFPGKPRFIRRQRPSRRCAGH
jgi:hypothetical protein